MRSVVVVLPASMCAMMPILRTRSSGKCRLDAPVLEAAVCVAIKILPTIVGKGSVGLSHLVGIFPLLEGYPLFLARRQDLVREPIRHGLTRPPSSRINNPSHGHC